MPAMMTELEWKTCPGDMLSAWMGLWELTVRPAPAVGGWQFMIVNPMGDAMMGRRLDRAVAIADCHELAERLSAGRE